RALLGNSYFASGRFASAGAAYRDSLALIANQPQVVLKLALVEIAQGRNAEALALLGDARGMLEPADHGLAVALAGQPREAAAMLEAAARQPGADARLRQNLALAYALSGDWEAARTIAAQDLSADLVDSRIQQWMALARPNAAADQVAALTGVKPVAGDPGQPVRLALRATPTRTAEAAPVAEQPQQVAAFAPQPLPEQADVPRFEQPAAAPAPEPAAAVIQAAAPAPAFVEADAGIEPAYVEPKRARLLSASFTAKLKPARPASFARRNGGSTAVVQLGAYGSPQRVAAAWNSAARRHSVLRGYSPVSARFNSSKGLVYRLSVKGFASASEAKSLCVSVRRAGGSCFVRSVAGDVPVRLASR
ncbi:MAG TPA: SPOR domain-containing protein, partial [Sphingomicrobium sp.]|nr:SPOR domain-containing protein [Sphingomicrobium sp.]